MDILFLIKNEHGRIEALLQGIQEMLAKEENGFEQDLSSLCDLLQLYIALDRELLYPELSELFGSSEKVIGEGHARHERILQVLRQLKGVFQGQAGSLGACDRALVGSLLTAMEQEVRGHFAHQQEQVIPRLRAHIPTQGREDLGQLYVDLKEEKSPASSGQRLAEQVG